VDLGFDFQQVVETVGKAVDLSGIAILIVGSLMAAVGFLRDLLRHTPLSSAYRTFRVGLGRAILLGLELLVAADIIRTVAVSPSFTSVGVLAIIVVIRTFLSTALEVELEGRWPWDKRADAGQPGASRADREAV
jgi:uncharacterized membrane protein